MQNYGLHNIKTKEDLESFKKDKAPSAIFFYHQENENEPLKSRLIQVAEEAEERMIDHEHNYIKLGMMNCLGEGISKKDVAECQKHRRSFYIYSGKRTERFDLRTLYDYESFMANLLNFVYDEKLGLALDEEDLKREQTLEKGKRDIILMYVNAVGSSAHYSFVSVAAMYINEYKFVYSTDENFATKLGMTEGKKFGLWYVNCTQLVAESEKPCPRVPYKGEKIDTSSIISFVRLSGLPILSEINNDGSSVYQDVNRLFLLVDNDESKKDLSTTVERVIDNTTKHGVSLRGVVVDKRKHANLLPMFGIYDASVLPTVFLEIADGRHSPNRELEQFTPDIDLTEENINNFVYSLVEDSENTCGNRAELYDITYTKLSDWKDIKNSSERAISVACSTDGDYKMECHHFKAAYRRVTRSLYESDITDFDFYYVDFTGKPKSSKIYKIPMMKLHLPGKDGIPFDTTAGRGYVRILEWLNKQLGLDVPRYPASCSDFVPIPSKQIDVNKASFDAEEDLKNLQDDEISNDAARVKSSQNDVEMLKDSTFNTSLSSTELLIVFFYVGWDHRSYLFQTVYADVHKTIGPDTPGSTISTKLSKVDCFAEQKTCSEQQVFTFPMIKVYRNGKYAADYKGMLDKENLIKAIRVYQLPALIKLDKHSVVSYTQGREPLPAAAFVDVSILGWFNDVTDEEFKVFEKVAYRNYGRALFGVVVGDKIGTSLDKQATTPYIQAFLRNDEYRTEVLFSQEYKEEELERFLNQVFVPEFGELTPLNFPLFRSLGQPLLVFFTKADKREVSIKWRSIRKITETGGYNIKSAWMSLDLSSTQNIRRSYLGTRKAKQSDIVIVDHHKNEVYLYSGPMKSVEEGVTGLTKWLTDFTDKKLNATSYLSKQNWKPKQEGFDFLHYIEFGHPDDNDGAEDDDSHSEGEFHDHSDTSTKETSFHGIKTPIRSPTAEEEHTQEYVDVVQEENTQENVESNYIKHVEL